jgi:chemotaxis signal transduction protein/LysM repeat protein
MRELLLLNLGGMNYGVWKDDVLSIKDIQTIHRLPLSPTCIAGMSILDGRTATLADLSVCIGLAPMPRQKKGHILIMSEQEKITGFVVAGDVASVTVPGDAVYPMPGYLKTPVLDTCVVHASQPIPVINISLLYTRVQKADREPPMAEFLVSAPRRLDASSINVIRVFESGGEPFAAAAAGIEEDSVKPGRVSGLALIPQYVRGIAFHRGTVIPVIHLAQTMKLPRQGTVARVLPAEIGGAGFGFLIDADQGALFSKDFQLKPLPPIALSRWMRAAALRHGEILPLVDLGALLSVQPGDKDDKPLPERYSPDSRFSSLFGSEEVEVTEFSLLGARHALPRSEVQDTLDFKPYRRVPNVQPIVAGVTEHEGELLPVLDLAMVFGRRSLVTPEWRMLLVKNGDFRALVITEAVYGPRRVGLEAQRGVPIVLPHHVVYGCYPEASSVRLILNVEALAVHFDRVLVKGFLRAISKEMEAAPSEIVSSLIEPEAAPEMAEGEGQRIAVPQQEAVEATASPASLDAASLDAGKKAEEIQETLEEAGNLEEPAAALSGPEATVQSGTQPADVQMPEAHGEPEAEHVPAPPAESASTSEAPPEPEAVIEPQPEVTSSEEAVPTAAEHREPVVPEELKPAETLEAEEPVRTEESARTEEPAVFLGSTEERQQTEELRPEVVQEASQETSQETEINKPEEPTIIRTGEKEQQEQTGPSQEPEIPADSGHDTGAAEEVPEEQEHRALQGAYESRAAESGEAAESLEEAVPRKERKEYAPKPAEHWQGYPESIAEKEDGNWLKYAGIAAVLFVVLYLLSIGVKSSREDGGKSKPVETAVTEKKPVAEPKTPKQKQAPAAPPEPLTLTIPPEMPLEADLYIVKKGDTLWAISKRFTGNPFNYPRVARDNKIANPDLIFPDQKIHLKR